MLAALLHTQPELMLVLGGERMSIADVVKDTVDAVYVVVDDGDVLTVLIHSLFVIKG
jgi:hypothetical protein